MDSDFPGYRFPEIDNGLLQDPHVVIIGAGASKAACPNGDRNGKVIPLLKSVCEIDGISECLETYDFDQCLLEDFELLFSRLYEDETKRDLVEQLETIVRAYFEQLELPKTVTLYDYLLLSLTSKDVVISFNWDPFLMQAFIRNRSDGNLPYLLFPHGNVAVYYCALQKTAFAFDNNICDFCHDCEEKMQPMKLLYPIGDKDYAEDPLIRSAWAEAEQYLSRAAGVTIFGYGAPDTDQEALKLLKKYFKESHIDEIAPFEVINLPSAQREQEAKWKEISSDRMFVYLNDFKDSMLWRSPRVSLEALFDAILQQQPRPADQSFREFDSLEELQSFARSIDGFKMAVGSGPK